MLQKQTIIKKKKKSIDSAAIRKYLMYGVVGGILYLINKKFLLILIFIVITMILKQMRTAFGINMIMFDPLTFFAACIVRFWGIGELLIFLFIAVFMADAVAGNLTPGSFLNYFLFHATPIVSNLIFGGLGLTVVAVIAQILYAVVYVPVRINFLGGSPFDTASKGITNILFCYLYCVFFADLMKLIM
ncbi:MAG: hypothetical protein V1859_04460 [archaeon]